MSTTNKDPAREDGDTSNTSTAVTAMDHADRTDRTGDQTCHFFRISPELRDMIYHHLWQQTPYITDTDPARAPRIAISYNDTVEDVGDAKDAEEAENESTEDAEDDESAEEESVVTYEFLPQWLLANKDILAEGVAALNRKSSYVLDLEVAQRLPFSTNSILQASHARKLNLLVAFPARRMLEYMITNLREGCDVQEITINLSPVSCRSIYFDTCTKPKYFSKLRCYLECLTPLFHSTGFRKLQTVVIDFKHCCSSRMIRPLHDEISSQTFDAINDGLLKIVSTDNGTLRVEVFLSIDGWTYDRLVYIWVKTKVKSPVDPEQPTSDAHSKDQGKMKLQLQSAAEDTWLDWIHQTNQVHQVWNM